MVTRPSLPIPFTQYMRPSGEQRPCTIDRPLEVAEAAGRLIQRGCVFEIEVLRTEEISMTCELGERTLAIEVCANGPPVPGAVDRLVAAATLALEGSTDGK